MSRSSKEIVLLVEGRTEIAIKQILKRFLDERCELENIPKVRLTLKPMDSRLLKPQVVKDQIAMNIARRDVVGVVALIDVACSGRPQQFNNAKEAIKFLSEIAPDENRYRAHAAQYDFEAWLLPYWESILKRLNQKKQIPSNNPETVNHNHPPSWHLQELYKRAGYKYDKPRDALAILTGKDLLVSANKCPQFKAFLNSLLHFAGCKPI